MLTFAAAVCICAIAIAHPVPAANAAAWPPVARAARSTAATLTARTVLPPGVDCGKRDTIDHLTVHHTATGARTPGGGRIDAAEIGRWHRARGISGPFRGTEACAYHFVILPDGTVQSGRPLNVRGSATKDRNDNTNGIAVVLVGDFDDEGAQHRPSEPTAAQERALQRLALWVFDHYGLGADDVYGHGELANSACPGRRLDMDALRRWLQQAAGTGDKGARPPVVVVP